MANSIAVATSRRLEDDLDDAHVLGVRERGRFTGGAHGHEPVDATRDLGLDEPPQRPFVDLAVAKRSDESRVCAAKHRVREASTFSVPRTRGARR
jgi:hypothetical protein